METKKIAVLLGALILVVGCLGNKSDVEVQSGITQTTIKEGNRPPMRGMGDRNESLARVRERLGLPENATEEEVREALREMRGNGSRPPFNGTYRKHIGGDLNDM